MTCQISTRGFTLIEVLVATGLMLIVFLGFFDAYTLSAHVVTNQVAEQGALSIVSSQMEYIRSLAYASVGTAGGTPSGIIPQSQQKTLNGTVYTLRTVVVSVDDLLNGSGTADYKSVKVEADWNFHGIAEQFIAVSYVAP